MARKQTSSAPTELPPSPYRIIDELELRVVYHHVHKKIATREGTQYLPRDLIGTDGKTLVIWRAADDRYHFDGWDVWHDGMGASRYESIFNALAWVRRAKEIRAGRAQDFLGC